MVLLLKNGLSALKYIYIKFCYLPSAVLKALMPIKWAEKMPETNNWNQTYWG